MTHDGRSISVELSFPSLLRTCHHRLEGKTPQKRSKRYRHLFLFRHHLLEDGNKQSNNDPVILPLDREDKTGKTLVYVCLRSIFLFFSCVSPSSSWLEEPFSIRDFEKNRKRSLSLLEFVSWLCALHFSKREDKSILVVECNERDTHKERTIFINEVSSHDVKRGLRTRKRVVLLSRLVWGPFSLCLERSSSLCVGFFMSVNSLHFRVYTEVFSQMQSLLEKKEDTGHSLMKCKVHDESQEIQFCTKCNKTTAPGMFFSERKTLPLTLNRIQEWFLCHIPLSFICQDLSQRNRKRRFITQKWLSFIIFVDRFMDVHGFRWLFFPSGFGVRRITLQTKLQNTRSSLTQIQWRSLSLVLSLILMANIFWSQKYCRRKTDQNLFNLPTPFVISCVSKQFRD